MLYFRFRKGVIVVLTTNNLYTGGKQHMYEKVLEVKNKTGLHARPASDLTVLCQKFDSKIVIITPDAQVNPKSIISILAGGISQGTSIRLQVEGADEEEAGKQISKFIEELKE